MTDFMRWLYANYIWPQLEKENPTGYEMALSVMDASLDKEMRKEYQWALEFYAGSAFLLGLRTGAGLGEAMHAPNADT